MRPAWFAILPLLILALALVAATGNPPMQASQAATQAVEMHMRRDVSDIAISGLVSSSGHEAILLEIIGRQESLTGASLDLSQADLSPPGWALLTELALQATLLTRFSETSIDESGVAIRGVTNDPQAWNAVLKQLQAALLPGMRLENRVLQFPQAGSFADLCRAQFAGAMEKGPLQFAPGQAEIDSQARALLDSLNETAADCARWQIKVRVHSDRSSSAGGDLQAIRAQSIVDYLTGNGLDPQRIAIATDAASTPGRYGQADFLVSLAGGDGEAARDAAEGSTRSTAAPLAN